MRLGTGFTVYVIESVEGYRYTGMTEDLSRRLREHNDHIMSCWTRRGTKWRLVYSESFEMKGEALKRERWLKGGVGREWLKRILTKK
jgi:putative endonuclease